MDPEPGRCRRTDGKKWRCYQSVVPSEKYCEKHMHRGRKRSRKLVEDASIEAPSINRNPNIPKSNVGFAVPAILNRKPLSLSEPSKAVVSAQVLTSIAAKGDEKFDLNNEGKHNRVIERPAAIHQAPVLDFSPKSVLPEGHRCLKVESHANPPNLVRQRCTGTDGKNWQRVHVTLPAQKFCAEHVDSKKAPDTTKSKAANVSSNARFSGQELAKTGSHLDTDLNISLPTRPGQPRHDIRDTEDSSSSETTVSDGNADVSDLIAFSP